MACHVKPISKLTKKHDWISCIWTLTTPFNMFQSANSPARQNEARYDIQTSIITIKVESIS